MILKNDSVYHATKIISTSVRCRNRAKQIERSLLSGSYNSIDEFIQKIETVVCPYLFSKQIQFAKQALELHNK